MTQYTATYCPNDNKLRLYSTERLDPETYAKIKEAGFIWAPKQECFVAPMWTPDREDVLLSLVDIIQDEDMTPEERAAERAERFEGYSEKRAQEAEQTYSQVQHIAENIPFGQPILVGHHSERKARKDAERIESGMRKTIKLWETSEYWTERAKASIRHVKYKERPDVRHRRIKGLEADARKYERIINETMTRLEFFQRPDLTKEKALHFLNYNHCGAGYWSDLRDDKATLEEVKEKICASVNRTINHYKRWLNHTNSRITFEKAMLGDWEPPKKERVKRELSPLVNFPSEGCKEMTAEEWKRVSKCSDAYQVRAFNLDGTPAKWREKGDYRRRCMCRFVGPDTPIFITDMPIKYPEGMEAGKAVSNA